MRTSEETTVGTLTMATRIPKADWSEMKLATGVLAICLVQRYLQITSRVSERRVASYRNPAQFAGRIVNAQRKRWPQQKRSTSRTVVPWTSDSKALYDVRWMQEGVGS